MMKKKISIILLCLSIFIFVPFCYASDVQVLEPAKDGIYELKGVATIRFFAPDGWKYMKGMTDASSVEFMDLESGGGLNIQTIIGDFGSSDSTLAIEEEKRILKGPLFSDKKILHDEDIYIVGVKAYSWTEKRDKTITKYIYFYKHNIRWVISFSSIEKNFDNLLPEADKAIKSFEIVEIKD